MAVFDGTYNPLLEGVSQQTPQERRDGQLSSQVNMVSDKVAGLRRRGGIKLDWVIDFNPHSYVKIIKVLGIVYVVAIDPVTGQVYIENFNTHVKYTLQNDYLKAVSKSSFKTVMSKDNFYIVNTEKVPTKESIASTRKNPKDFGYFSVRGSTFNKMFEVVLTHSTLGGVKRYTVTTSGSDANQASPDWVAGKLRDAINADTSITGKLIVTLEGTTVSLELTDKSATDMLDVQSASVTGSFMLVSGTSRVSARSELLGTLPTPLDGYTLAVGNTGNSSYYQYNNATKSWKEVAAFEPAYRVKDEPIYLTFNKDNVPSLKTLGIKMREAGEDDNNPLPSFMDFGITGIGAYQSRLVLLSGAYVNLSKTNSFDTYMRTSVTELLDDDPIEVSNATLSSAQFEYCVPFNKDLVLIAQDQQAVIPANNTVLTPRTAVVYTSTDLDLSLAVSPVSIGRTIYYAYQRGVEYYQIGEFLPNAYTDGQYYNQNLTDHIPLYAEGVCNVMTASTTNNMVVMGSGTKDLLINQYMWAGDSRVQMAFHKWNYPYNVMYAQFLQEYLVTFMEYGSKIIVGTQNVQINQLRSKPIPFLDLYSYVTITNGTGTLPDTFYEGDLDNLIAVIYDSGQRRHKMVAMTVKDGIITTPYLNGTIAIGYAFESEFTITPPFMKDANGRVIAGADSRLRSINLTLDNSGKFNVQVKDVMGQAYASSTTAETWSETDLGYSWINGIGDLSIPCRTRMNSTEFKVFTQDTYDVNVVSIDYVLRVPSRRRRL